MKLTHPDAPKTVIDVKAEHAEAYTSQGWEQADEPAEKPKGK